MKQKFWGPQFNSIQAASNGEVEKMGLGRGVMIGRRLMAEGATEGEVLLWGEEHRKGPVLQACPTAVCWVDCRV